MSKYFVDDPPVPIAEFPPDEAGHEAPPNVIVIRAKMDVATDARVKNDLMSMNGSTAEISLGGNEMALLIHNILSWSGPDLDGVPCDAAHIRSLDPTAPHVAAVLAEITRRNARPKSPNPKPPAGSLSASNGAAASSLPAASGANAAPVIRGRRSVTTTETSP